MAKTKTKKRPEVEYVAGANEKREKLMGYLMAMPAIILLIAFTVYPLCYLRYRSFFGGSVISRNPKFVGFENYKALVESTDFHQVLMNTAIYTVITVGLKWCWLSLSPYGLTANATQNSMALHRHSSSHRTLFQWFQFPHCSCG